MFDSPHPIQFKTEWSESSSGAAEDIRELKAHFMAVTLESLNVNLSEVGWSRMSEAERGHLYEEVVFQGLGRKLQSSAFDAGLSDTSKAISSHWNTGITRTKDGDHDMSAWEMVAGRGTQRRFHRLQAPVVLFRAGAQDDALFHGSVNGTFCHGPAWSHIADRLEVIEGVGTHYDLVRHNTAVGGDLDTVIAPHLTVRMGGTPPSATLEAHVWTREVWSASDQLPLWQDATLTGEGADLDLDANVGHVVLGLNHASQGVGMVVDTMLVFVHDLLDRSSLDWGALLGRLQMPCVGMHVSPSRIVASRCSSRGLQGLGAALLRGILGVMPSLCPAYGNRRVLLAAYAEMGDLAFEVAHQLLLHGIDALAVQICAAPEPTRTPSASPVLQALYAHASVTMTYSWHAFAELMVAATPDEQLAFASATKPLEVTQVEWDGELHAKLRAAMALHATALENFGELGVVEPATPDAPPVEVAPAAAPSPARDGAGEQDAPRLRRVSSLTRALSSWMGVRAAQLVPTDPSNTGPTDPLRIAPAFDFEEDGDE